MRDKRRMPACASESRPGVRAGAEAGRVARRPPLATALLLELDSRTCTFKLLLDLRRLVLVDALLDRLRSRLDKVLRFLEAEPRDGADLLDDVDLLLADRGEND